MKRYANFFLELTKVISTFLIALGVAFYQIDKKGNPALYQEVNDAFAALAIIFGIFAALSLFFVILDK